MLITEIVPGPESILTKTETISTKLSIGMTCSKLLTFSTLY